MASFNGGSQVNTFAKGMQLDADPSAVQYGTYTYAENMRIADAGSSGSITNIGSIVDTGSVMFGEVLGSVNCGSYTVVVTKLGVEHFDSDMPGFSKTKELVLNGVPGSKTDDVLLVYKHSIKDDADVVNLIAILYDGSKSSTNQPIRGISYVSMLSSIEGPKIHRVYMADKTHPLYSIDSYREKDNEVRVIDILKAESGSNSFSSPSVSVSLSDGSLRAGRYFYVVKYLSESGAESKAVAITAPIDITVSSEDGGMIHADTGNTDVTGKGIRIDIDNVDKHANAISVYRVYAKSSTLNPEIHLIYSEPTSGSKSVSFTDGGMKALDDVSISQSNIASNRSPIVGTIDSKDNILIAGNIKYRKPANLDSYDTRAFTFDITGKLGYRNINDPAGTSSKELLYYDGTTSIDSDPNYLRNLGINDDDFICDEIYTAERYRDVRHRYAPSLENGAVSDNPYFGGVGVNVRYRFIHSYLVAAAGGELTKVNPGERKYFRDDLICPVSQLSSNKMDVYDAVCMTMSRDNLVAKYGDYDRNITHISIRHQSGNIERVDINKFGIAHHRGKLDYSNGLIAGTLAGFKRNEVYRFAAKFIMSDGSETSPRWIADIRFPSNYIKYHSMVDEVGSEKGISFSFNSFCAPEDFNESIYDFYSASHKDEDYFKSTEKPAVVETVIRNFTSGPSKDRLGIPEFYEELLVKPLGLRFTFSNVPTEVEKIVVMYSPMDYFDRSIVGQFFVNRIGTFSTGGMTADQCNKMNYFEGASCDGYSYPQPIPSMKYSSAFVQMMPLYNSGIRGFMPLGTQFKGTSTEAKDGVIGNGKMIDGDGYSSNGGCGILGFETYSSLNTSFHHNSLYAALPDITGASGMTASYKAIPEEKRSSTAVSTSPYFSDFTNYMLCNPESSYLGDSYASMLEKLQSSIVFENIVYSKMTMPWVAKNTAIDRPTPGSARGIFPDRLIPTIGKYLRNAGLLAVTPKKDIGSMEYANAMYTHDDTNEVGFGHAFGYKTLTTNGWSAPFINEASLSRIGLTAQSAFVGGNGGIAGFHDNNGSLGSVWHDAGAFTEMSSHRSTTSSFGLTGGLPMPTYLLCASYLTNAANSTVDDSSVVTQCATGALVNSVKQAAKSDPLAYAGMVFPLYHEDDGGQNGIAIVKCLPYYFSSNLQSLSTPHVGHCEDVTLCGNDARYDRVEVTDQRFRNGTIFGDYGDLDPSYVFGRNAVTSILCMKRYEKTFSVYRTVGMGLLDQNGIPRKPIEILDWDYNLGLRSTFPVSIKTFMSGQGYSPVMVRSNLKTYSNHQNGEDNGGDNMSNQMFFYGWDNGIDNNGRKKEITIGESTLYNSPELATLTGNHASLSSYKIKSAMKYYKSINSEPRFISGSPYSVDYDHRSNEIANKKNGAEATKWLRYGTYYRYISLMYQNGYEIDKLDTSIGFPAEGHASRKSVDFIYSPAGDFGGKYKFSKAFKYRYDEPVNIHKIGIPGGPWDIAPIGVESMSYAGVISGPYAPMSGSKSIPARWANGFINYSKSLRHDIIWDDAWYRRPSNGAYAVMNIACSASPSPKQADAIANREFNHSSFKSIRARKSGGISGKHGAGILVTLRSTIPMIGHIAVSDAQQKYMARFACDAYTNPGDLWWSNEISGLIAKRRRALVDELSAYNETLYGAAAAHTSTFIVDMRAKRHPLSSRLSKIDKANSKYIECACATTVTANPTGGKNTFEMRVFGGDTYVGLFDYTSTYADTPATDERLEGKGPLNGDAWNQTALLCQSNRINVLIPMESYMNVHVDGGLSGMLDSSPWTQNKAEDSKSNPVGIGYAKDPYILSQNKDEYVYIDGFSYKKKFAQVEENMSTDERFNSFEHPSRVILSEPKTYGEQVDSWTKFKPANYMDIESSNGEINAIKTYKDRTYAFQDRAVTFLSINERSLISDGAAGASQLLLGTAKGFGGYRVIDDHHGLSVGDERAIYKGSESIYFFDRLSRSLCSVNQVTKDMSLINGVRKFSESILPGVHSYNESTKQSNFIVGPFGDGDEILFSSRTSTGKFAAPHRKTLLNSERAGILYSESADGFESFLSGPSGFGMDISHSFETDRQSRLLIRDEDYAITKLMKESRSKFSNSLLGFVSNNNYPATKVFDSSDINMSFSQNKTHPYKNPGVEISAQYFNSIAFTNPIMLAVGSRNINGTMNEDMRYSENRNADIHTAIPRSGNDELSRMRDKYIESSYRFISRGERISIPYIKTNYRESRR